MAGNLVSTVSVGMLGAKRSVNDYRHVDAGESALVEVRRHASRSMTENRWIPLAKSAQAVARAAKREVRVAARGAARNQAARRWRSIAAAVATCCRRVLASPR